MKFTVLILIVVAFNSPTLIFGGFLCDVCDQTPAPNPLVHASAVAASSDSNIVPTVIGGGSASGVRNFIICETKEYLDFYNKNLSK